MREDTHVDTIIFKEYTNFQCSILELSHSKFFFVQLKFSVQRKLFCNVG